MDLEYTALRRRMSRVRVQQARTSESDTELDTGPQDMYADLVKFWKKRGTNFAAEMIPASEQLIGKHAPRQRGRRKSVEFEDLQMQTSSGRLKLSVPNKPGLKGHDKVTSFPTKADWAGDPGAISSVRRPRKTINEQQRNFVMNRSSTEKTMGKKEKKIVTEKLSGVSSTPRKQPVGRTVSDSVIKKLTPTNSKLSLTTEATSGLSRKGSEKNASVVKKIKEKSPSLMRKNSKK
ncbi:hypothetical protein ScPMuIL_011828 [Solemya velum]